MPEIFRESIATGGRQRRAAGGFIIALSLLLGFVSSANASQLCQVCHGLLGPHAPQCGDTSTCGVSCHTGKLQSIQHPTGSGTPLQDISTASGITKACTTCHMPPAVSTTHPYMINTFPTTSSSYPGVDQVCGQCHGGSAGSGATKNGAPYYDVDFLSLFAKNIHQTLPVANFLWTASTTASYLVSFNASNSTCPTTTCTYVWDFGDGAQETDSVLSTSHLYSGPTYTAGYNVTLTVVGAPPYNPQSYPVTKPVVASAVHVKPTASVSAGPTVTGWTVSLTDASRSNTPNGWMGSVKVNWGDGVVSVGAVNDTFSHTYPSSRARSFWIIHTAVDGGSLMTASEKFMVLVPERYSVTTVVKDHLGNPLNGSIVSIRKNGHTMKYQKLTGDSFTFTSVLPGDYTVRAYKSGAVIQDRTLSVLNSDTTVTLTATSP